MNYHNGPDGGRLVRKYTCRYIRPSITSRADPTAARAARRAPATAGSNGRTCDVSTSAQFHLQRSSHQAALRQFHRRQVRRSRGGPLFRQSEPGHRRQALRNRPLQRRRHRARARRRAQGQGRLGQDLGRRALETSSTRSPTAWRRSPSCWRWSRRSTTASRSARRPTPTCRCASTTSATSPAPSAPRKARSPKSTTTPSPIISMSRSASSARSFPGISRC